MATDRALAGDGPQTSRAAWTALASLVFTLAYAIWLILRLGGDEALRILSDVLFQVPSLAATAACAVAAARTRGRERAGWAAIAIGIGLWSTAEWVWSCYDLFLRVEPPLFSAADPLYYLGYPFILAGIALLVVPAPGSRLDVKSLIDALLVITVLSIVAWNWLLLPLYEATRASTTEVLVTFGYPVLDFALVMALVFTFYRVQGNLTVPATLLIAGMLTTTVADGIYLYTATVSGYDVYGNPLELIWIASYFAFAVAAVARLDEGDGRASEAARPLLNRRLHRIVGLALPYVVALPLIAFKMYEVSIGILDLPLSAGIVLVLALAFVRQLLTLAEGRYLARHGRRAGGERHLLPEQS